DNEGWLGLTVAASATLHGNEPALYLFRNDGSGKFVDRSSVIPTAVRAAGASAIAVSDADDDGDEDLWLIDGSGAPRLLRNDSGNNHLPLPLRSPFSSTFSAR